MRKLVKLKKLLKSRKTAFVLGSAAGGAIAGFTGGLPGLRTEGAKEGALTGAAYTGAALLGARVVFRRIGGKIRPFKIRGIQ